MVNRKRANPEGRKRTKCQLCPLSVVHMLRHLMSTHGLSRQEAKQAKVQEGHAMRTCRVEGCHAVVKRLDKHLKNVHKLVGGTTEYAASLKTKISLPDNKKIDSPATEEEPLWTQERCKGSH
uniref:Uncharacterized protein LOC111116410 n=1 Tax=Crassostrea virginica TaxID=6565 RepID=A0A8B8C677_CRAVI|nr:uncharacterized protein LOC111116410 [Crassostrea virginica]